MARCNPTLEAHVPDCLGGESFALMVLGFSMPAQFQEGKTIIIEPEGLAKDGFYVLAWHHDEWTFRQGRRADEQCTLCVVVEQMVWSYSQQMTLFQANGTSNS